MAHLMHLMSSGGYYGQRTCHQLGELWGVSWQTVCQDAAEAGRFLRLDPAERDARRQEMMAWFSQVAQQALSERSKVTGLPDFKAALEAMRLCGIYQGISDRVAEADNASNVPKAPVKIEIVKSNTMPTPSKDEPGADGKD